jgi:hypothetical protein
VKIWGRVGWLLLTSASAGIGGFCVAKEWSNACAAWFLIMMVCGAVTLVIGEDWI